jgi:hypothetical protein
MPGSAKNSTLFGQKWIYVSWFHEIARLGLSAGESSYGFGTLGGRDPRFAACEIHRSHEGGRQRGSVLIDERPQIEPFGNRW